ncbi:MAG: tripartite tricarboxylate transporter TctB family protein, partial [bacterium]
FVFTQTAAMPRGEGGAPGPAFFPRFVAAIIGFLGLLLLFQDARSHQAQSVTQPPDTRYETETTLPARNWLSAILFLILIVLYGLSIHWLGYILSTFLFLVIAVHGMRRSHIWSTLVFSACVVAGIYFAFGVVMKVSLPVFPMGF